MLERLVAEASCDVVQGYSGKFWIGEAISILTSFDIWGSVAVACMPSGVGLIAVVLLQKPLGACDHVGIARGLDALIVAGGNCHQQTVQVGSNQSTGSLCVAG